jgi:hypothetical protein
MPPEAERTRIAVLETKSDIVIGHLSQMNAKLDTISSAVTSLQSARKTEKMTNAFWLKVITVLAGVDLSGHFFRFLMG